MNKVHICTGSCQAVVSDETYTNGLTQCGAENCSKKGELFIDAQQCSKCGKIVRDEKHTC